jgi:hypothetical protein
MLTLVAAAAAVPALAADPRHPDWPCAQIKVPQLSVAAVWTGPPIDDVRDSWQSDHEVGEMVARLAARRTSLEEAEQLIAEFLEGPGQQQKAKLLFAGLFDTLDRERSTVMDGIERFVRKQKSAVERIRAKTSKLHRLQDESHPDQAGIDELANQLSWDIRVYEDERKTIGYVCEVPQTIERRLFALSRIIQQNLD